MICWWFSIVDYSDREVSKVFVADGRVVLSTPSRHHHVAALLEPGENFDEAVEGRLRFHGFRVKVKAPPAR